jgi:hypothetical protein
MKKPRRWEIAICERGTVHVHYGTGSLHILKEDFVDLAEAFGELAYQFDDVRSTDDTRIKKGLMQ